jgi:D-sedoheptulose 7-phosphate isomerase
MNNQVEFVLQLRNHFEESAETKRRTVEICGDAIFNAAVAITEAFRSDKKLLLCGNGGSAADCQHMATEFVSRLTKDFNRPALPALALTTASTAPVTSRKLVLILSPTI